MCYVEDVFHARCGHWSSKPRISHACICARYVERPAYNSRNLHHFLRRYVTVPYDCKHKQSRGSVLDEETICDQCIARESGRRASERQVGMWLSVYTNSDGSWVETDRDLDLTERMLRRSMSRRRQGSVPALLRLASVDANEVLAAIGDEEKVSPRRSALADSQPELDPDAQADMVR